MSDVIKFEYGFESVNGIVKKVYHLHEIPKIAEKCDVWNVLPVKYVRRFTDSKTKNGKEIFEGDIFREEIEQDEGDIRTYSAVVWIRQRGAFYLVPVAHLPILRDNDVSKEKEFSWLFDDANLYDFSLDIGLPLVGNIYENPELLK